VKTRTIVIPLTLLAAAGMGIFALTKTATDVKSTSIDAGKPTIEEPAAPKQCAYVWAYQDMPDISKEFQAEARTVIPEADAHASAYGENCVYEDGSATFSTLETDFYVTILVDSLTNYEKLATVIEQILPIVDRFAPPRVPGPNEGFVEFTFQHGEEQHILRVPIPLGKQLREQDLHGVELIQALEIK
jgi:hypothetical protein